MTGRVRRTAARAAATLIVVSLGSAALAAEIVFADGRRETVADPRQDSKGQWLATRDGRRTILRPGDVVAIVDDAGKETVTIPALADPPDPPEVVASLAGVRDAANADWEAAAERLAQRPSQAVVDALVTLAADRKKDLRVRAYRALCRLRTRESVLAAAGAILQEKDAALRREASSVLFSVQEIFERSDRTELVRKGLADKDAGVRFAFACLAPADLAEATAVLRADGLASTDHHVRESAAMELGRRGDAAGEAVLAAMLARTSLPGAVRGDPTYEHLLVKEQVEVCAILGKLGTEKGLAALRKATASKHEDVRKAAEAALAAAAAK